MQRQVWLDVARGLAVISMVVAHTAPVGGVFNVSEYLTMPWFAMLMGCALWFAWVDKGGSAGRFAVVVTLRGLVLVVLGIIVIPIYDQVAVVLQTLGFGSIIVGWIIPWAARRPWPTAGLAVVLWLVSPPVIGWARMHWSGTGGPADQLLSLVAVGPYYRGITTVVWLLVGVAVAHHLSTGSTATRRRLLIEAGVLTLVTGAWHLLVRKLLPAQFMPYSGTLVETGHNAVLAMAATWWCVALLRDQPTLEGVTWPLQALGGVALTAYVLQLVILRFLTSVFLGGGRDDHWWVLLTCCALLIGFAVVSEKLAWPRPVEYLIRVPERLLGVFRRGER